MLQQHLYNRLQRTPPYFLLHNICNIRRRYRLSSSFSSPPPSSTSSSSQAFQTESSSSLNADNRLYPTTHTSQPIFWDALKRPTGCDLLALDDVGHFKRPLPAHLIAFNSTSGRQLFKKALDSDCMEPYFALCGNYVHQSDVAWCGPSTLTMVLNAMEQDPRKLQWKFPWRWYTDDQVVSPAFMSTLHRKQRGITFDEFAHLAKEHGLNAEIFRPESLHHFRQMVKKVCHTPGQHLVVSFSRKTLGQTGVGHFSPIGGYIDDHLLVMDVARFKYPAYWASTETLFQSMQTLDPATNLPRGYIVLSRRFTI